MKFLEKGQVAHLRCGFTPGTEHTTKIEYFSLFFYKKNY